MTELPRRMEEDMIVRGMADRTRESYLWAVTGLAKFYRRSPDQISDEEVQAYLLHLIRDRKRSWNTCHTVVHGLLFFYHTTLKRDRTTFCIPTPRQSGKFPAILSRAEVQRLIAHATTPKQRTMLLRSVPTCGLSKPRPDAGFSAGCYGLAKPGHSPLAEFSVNFQVAVGLQPARRL